MKKIHKMLLVLLFVSSPALAGEYAVISNKNMKDLTLIEVRAIFLKKITLIDDINLVPINLEARDELRLKFEEEVLDMSFSRLKTYWTKEHYLGHRPPISMKSQESIKAFINKVDGSIGYINLENVDENMKILYKWRD
jgi:ABC-type phosphate transport system substrate-binding protein